MDRAQLIRRTRIAASVFFAMIAVALCALWARSYWRMDSTVRTITANRHVIISSVAGRYNVELLRTVKWNRGGRTYAPQVRRIAAIPHWCPLLVVCGMSAASWRVRQFSLRTMITAMTMLAIVLGMAVWAVR
jgi:hypothetical protein